MKSFHSILALITAIGTISITYKLRPHFTLLVPTFRPVPRSRQEPNVEPNVASSIILNTTICSDKCYGNCMHFLTPTYQCYNGQMMFPNGTGRHTDTDTDTDTDTTSDDDNNNPFGNHDIQDVLNAHGNKELGSESSHKSIRREFYKSTDGSCSGGITDTFDNIPLDQCVGPYGPPRPWGISTLIYDKMVQEKFVSESRVLDVH